MTSETMAPCASSSQEPSRPSIPSRRSSVSRNNSALAIQVASAAASSSLPQRSAVPATTRHSLHGGNLRSPDLLSYNLHSRSLSTREGSCSVNANRRSASFSTAKRGSMHPARVQRWAGLTRTVSDWDGLRRDPELWFEDGDCLVHLHARGASRRGPSFCIPFRVLRQKKCSAMLSLCDAQTTSTTGSDTQPLRRMPSSLNSPDQGSSTIQLYIAAPEDASRADSFKWHVTTRNLFAFLLGKPLVGEHMGQAFVDLQERLNLFRPGQTCNTQDFLDYAENQGYRDLVECTDYALASLYYAEHYKIRPVWIDAFAHCVGMHESLVLSPEYVTNSRLTKALIARAYLEADAHLNRVSTALSKFLDEDLSPAYLGLTDSARNHLDIFRRFLHSFYVEKFGHWPPPKGASFPKALYKSMYYDFQNLYDHLVDMDSTTNISLQKPASGGICVLQTVMNFDKRHKFKAQPHPLPLIPAYVPATRKSESQKALRQLTLASQHNKTHLFHTMSAALAVATNDLKKEVAASKIVQAYSQFETSYAMDTHLREDKFSAVDARKVRWLLIYGTLQYLVSALRAPSDVRDSESPEYPLCGLIGGHSTWNADSTATTPLVSTPTVIPQAIEDRPPEAHCNSLSIQPDCHREDYFTSRPAGRRCSVEMPAPLKTVVPSRAGSVRSIASRSLSVRSSHRNSTILKPNQHCAIIVHGYGDGLNMPTQAGSRRGSSVYSEMSSASVLPEGAGPETSWLRPRTPSLPHSRNISLNCGSTISRSESPLHDTTQPTNVLMGEPPSRSDSTSSTSSVWSEGASAASSKSSADGDQSVLSKSSTVESSGLLGGLVSVGSPAMDRSRPISLIQTSTPQSHIHPLLRQSSQQDTFQFGFNEISRSTPGEHYSSMTDSTIGMAVSDPPSPPLRAIPDSQATFTSLDTVSLPSGERPSPPLRSITRESASTIVPVSKKGRGTDVFSAFIEPTSEIWEQYKAALTRPDSRATTSSISTPAATKASSGFKVPSFRMSKLVSEADSTTKKERRISSLWRR